MLRINILLFHGRKLRILYEPWLKSLQPSGKMGTHNFTRLQSELSGKSAGKRYVKGFVGVALSLGQQVV